MAQRRAHRDGSASHYTALILEAARTSTTLTIKGKNKKTLHAVKVEPAMRGGERMLLFYFPREVEITAENKEVEFLTYTAIYGGIIETIAKFKLREMVHGGKSDI